jgi:hypothetical protein
MDEGSENLGESRNVSLDICGVFGGVDWKSPRPECVGRADQSEAVNQSTPALDSSTIFPTPTAAFQRKAVPSSNHVRISHTAQSWTAKTHDHKTMSLESSALDVSSAPRPSFYHPERYAQSQRKEAIRDPQGPRSREFASFLNPSVANACQVEGFVAALQKYDAAEAIKLYPSVEKSGLQINTIKAFLNLILDFGYQGRRIAFRREEVRRSIAATVRQVAGDLKTGKLDGSPVISNAILNTYRNIDHYDDFVDFFEWARSHGTGSCYCDMKTYGLAIDVFTKHSKTHDLSDLEDLYQEALQSPHDTSLLTSYHLSDNAKLRDRDVHTPVSTTPELSILLEEIVTARAAFGDWRAAYLGLDTYLRLNCERPLKWGKLVSNRPSLEGYTLCRMAHMNGRATSASPIHRVTNLLAIARMEDITEPAVLRGRLNDVCKTMDLVARHAELSSTLTGSHITAILKSLQSIAKISGKRDEDTEKGRFAKKIADWAENIYDSFEHLRKTDDATTLNTLLAISWQTYYPELFSRTMNKIKKRRFANRPDTLRITLTGVGHFGDFDLAKQTWLEIKQGKGLEDKDWYTLEAVLGKLSTDEALNFWKDEAATEEAGQFWKDQANQAATKGRISPNRLSKTYNHSTPAIDYQSCLAQLSPCVEEFTSRLKAVTKDSGRHEPSRNRSPQVRSAEETTSTALYLKDRRLGATSDLWRIYDEVSTDAEAPHTVEAPQTRDTAESTEAERITMETLDTFPNAKRRFENWVMVTELMAMAERNEGENVEEDFDSTTPLYTDFKRLREYVLTLRSITL